MSTPEFYTFLTGTPEFYTFLTAQTLVLHTTTASGGGGGNPVSPWQHFTPGQGIKYGVGFGSGTTIIAIRHLPQHQEAETLEFLVNGTSHSRLTMPLDLPDDVVGCIGLCAPGAVNSASITAVAPAAFISGANGRGHGTVNSSVG